MSAVGLVCMVVAGAALLALWIEIRFAFGPRSITRGALHVGAGLLVLAVVPIAMRAVLGEGASAAVTALALLGLFLPAMVYTLLTGLWFMKAARDLLPSR